MTSVQWIGFLKTVAIPAGATLLVLLALWRPWRRDGTTPCAPIPVATAIGFLVGSVAILGWSGAADLPGLARALWPVDPTRRMGHYGLMALMGALVISRLPDSKARRWRAARLLIQFGVVTGAATLLLMPRIRMAWTPTESVGAVAGLGVVGVVWWNAIGGAGVRRPGALIPLTLAVVSVASAATLFVTGSASLAQQAVMLGVVLAICAVGALVRPALVGTPLIGAAPATLFAMLWGAGMFYSDDPIPTPSLVLMGVGPLLVWVALAPRVRHWAGWRAGSVQILLAILVMGGAGAIAATFVPDDGGKGPPAPSSSDWDSIEPQEPQE